MASPSAETAPVPGPDPDAVPFPPQAAGTLPYYNHGPSLLATSWVLLGLSALALGLRLFCKWISNRRLWWDDCVLIASWIAFAIDVGLTTYLVELGLGKPFYAMDFNNLPKFVVAILVRGTFAITSIAWSKTGFAITMLRLTEGWTRRFIWFLIISVNLALGFSALMQWVQCTPVQSAWDPTVLDKTCWSKQVQLVYNLFSGAWSAAADFVLALLPWQVLAQLHMNNREKIGAGIAMSMGIVAGIIAIVKTANLSKIYSDDQSEGHILMIWDVTETGVTIIAASIPALRVLFRRVRNGTTTSNKYTLSNLQRSNPPKPMHLESQNDDNFSDANYGPQAADARSDKAIFEVSVVSIEEHQVDGKKHSAQGDLALSTRSFYET